MRHRKPERRQKRPLGPMQLERTVETLPSFQRVVMRFNFITDLRADCLACFQFIKAQPEVVKMMSSGTPATPKSGMNQDCRNVEAALAKMSLQELAKLKLRWLMHNALN